MGLFPYLCFTRLLRDGRRESLGRYADKLSTAFGAWEGSGAAISFRPSDPLHGWCSPLADGTPWRVGQDVAERTVYCRIAASDAVRSWDLALRYDGAPRITGALFAEDPGVHLDDRASEWRGYGDHLIESAIADTASYIDGSGEIVVRGFESSIYLVNRFEVVFKGSRAKVGRISDTTSAEALIRAVEQALGGGLLSREIVTIAAAPKKMRRFLARCDTETIETLGANELSRVLAPLGLTLKQWRRAR